MTSIEQKIIDLNASPLTERVYLLLLTIPKGKVTTYKAIGDALGTKAYRAIGSILTKNPFIPDVPCHRVIGSNRTLTGYALGVDRKKELLLFEGVLIENNTVDISCITTVT